MSRFHACAAEAGVQLAAPDHAAADPGPQGDHHRRITAPGRAGPVLSDGCAVSVVAQIEGQFQLPLEQSPERGVPKGHIGRFDHHALPVVHQAGQPRPRRLELRDRAAALLCRLPGQTGQTGGQFLRSPAPVHRTGGLVEDLPLPVHQSGHQIGAAYVKSDIHPPRPPLPTAF